MQSETLAAQSIKLINQSINTHLSISYSFRPGFTRFITCTETDITELYKTFNYPSISIIKLRDSLSPLQIQSNNLDELSQREPQNGSENDQQLPSNYRRTHPFDEITVIFRAAERNERECVSRADQRGCLMIALQEAFILIGSLSHSRTEGSPGECGDQVVSNNGGVLGDTGNMILIGIKIMKKEEEQLSARMHSTR